MHGCLIIKRLPRNLLILLLCMYMYMSYFHVSAETFYVTPTVNSSCPEEALPCVTLSQYANTSLGYFTSNSSLILLPGNHSLDLNLSISNITSLSFYANDRYTRFMQSVESTLHFPRYRCMRYKCIA